MKHVKQLSKLRPAAPAMAAIVREKATKEEKKAG